MKNIINVLEKIARQLEIMNSNNGKCEHELEELNYYYDDDWGFKGSTVWNNQGEEKMLYYCKKCRHVLVIDRDK